ncbi:MAG: hypothetical protein FD126_3240, partial [Elusimicrobia bacterium]
DVEEVKVRTNYVAGDGALASTGRPQSQNSISKTTVGPPDASEGQRGVQMSFRNGMSRFESLNGRFTETLADDQGFTRGRGKQPLHVYRTATGAVAYSADGKSFFFDHPGTGEEVALSAAQTRGLRPVQRSVIETRAAPGGPVTVSATTFYLARSGDKVIQPRKDEDGERVYARLDRPATVVLSTQRGTGDNFDRIDYEAGTHYARRGNTAVSFELSADWKALARSRSRTVYDLTDGTSKAMYTEYLQEPPKDGPQTWTLMRSTTQRAPATTSFGGSITLTTQVGDRSRDSWEKLDTEFRTAFLQETDGAKGAGRFLRDREDNKVVSTAVTFDREGGPVSDARRREAFLAVKRRLGRVDAFQYTRTDDLMNDSMQMFKLFDGGMGKKGDVDTFDASYSFTPGSWEKGKRVSGGSATVTLRRFDRGTGRSWSDRETFQHMDLSEIPPTSSTSPAARTPSSSSTPRCRRWATCA